MCPYTSIQIWSAATSQNSCLQRSGTRPLRAEGGWAPFLGLAWVTPLVARGAARQLSAGDLFELPGDLQPAACAAVLWREWTQVPHISMRFRY